MQRLKSLVFTFVCVTTGSTIMAAIFISIFYQQKDVDGSILWQILITSAICCLGNFLYPNHKISKRTDNILHVIQYLYVMTIVIGGGLYFEWFHVNQIHMIATMFISVTIVYVVIMCVTFERTKRDSERINERLQNYHKRNLRP